MKHEWGGYLWGGFVCLTFARMQVLCLMYKVNKLKMIILCQLPDIFICINESLSV